MNYEFTSATNAHGDSTQIAKRFHEYDSVRPFGESGTWIRLRGQEQLRHHHAHTRR
ncbi:MAG: hypothetical protein HN505_13150 [Verrucomicrobia bacterium]|nr:hypothetical protein [Verrucomicrobiota bacterium]